jgi:SAM-dependent methyltransferase
VPKLIETADKPATVPAKNLRRYGQYKADIFNKLNFNFERGRRLLDLGCGDGTDAEIFINEFGLETYGIDVFTHENIKRLPNFTFRQASALNIPFEDNFFDYVFAHDLLHHVDEERQSPDKHLAVLQEIGRVVKPGGTIVLVEGNRYNPLFYPHMVKILRHNHWRQGYFEGIIARAFSKVEFRNFEAHAYPWALSFWKLYENLMEQLSPRQFLAYNVAIIQK